jgi:hypothetical protein
MAKIVWLASYPKSGNTWVRFLIANLIVGKAADSGLLTRQIPDIGESISGHYLLGRKTTIVKTHWKFTTELPLREDTIGVIYILRNPIDVLESNQNYAFMRSGNLRREASPEQVATLAHKFAETYIAEGGHPQFRQFGVGSWEENVRSWTWPDIAFPRLILRYEDIKTDTPGRLGQICRFLKLRRNDAEIERAVSAASMEAMKAMEAREIAARTEGFFFQRRNQSAIAAGHRFVGRSDDGRGLFRLTDDQRRRAQLRFEPLMRQFGYL